MVRIWLIGQHVDFTYRRVAALFQRLGQPVAVALAAVIGGDQKDGPPAS
jgi:hypothetical protein